jgi:hypothetical protein
MFETGYIFEKFTKNKAWSSDRSANRTRPIEYTSYYRMGPLSDPTCAACGIEEESAFRFMCVPNSGKPRNSNFR